MIGALVISFLLAIAKLFAGIPIPWIIVLAPPIFVFLTVCLMTYFDPNE